MINKQLIQPKSIAIVGGSDNSLKPGGKIVYNLLNSDFTGKLYIVNPKSVNIKGVTCFSEIKQLPVTDLAILAIPAQSCVNAVSELIQFAQVKAFIIISAGFSEESEKGKKIENEILQIVTREGCSLIGPNCIGIATPFYNGIFTTPTPNIKRGGCDLISSSGATAVFIMESGIKYGLKFNSIFSVGNAVQNGVEEVLEYLDGIFNLNTDAAIKLVYIESIRNPQKLLKHALSLRNKGCKIVALKSGNSEAGAKAASSHTGAMANPDTAVHALFLKAGIFRCNSRSEMISVASVLTFTDLKGKKILIVTHAGGPAVILSDALSNFGFELPNLSANTSNRLLQNLYPGASAKNPVDILATGTPVQLNEVLNLCTSETANFDAVIVIFGSPGLESVTDAYLVLSDFISKSKIPVYPVLPSVINAGKEMEQFASNGFVYFTDEVALAHSMQKTFTINNHIQDFSGKRNIIEKSLDEIPSEFKGFLPTEFVTKLLFRNEIPVLTTLSCKNLDELDSQSEYLTYPLVAKINGPVHKTDVGGVVLNISNKIQLSETVSNLLKIEGAIGVTIQPQVSGIEIFIGAKYEPGYGYILMCGLGGIFVEVLKDLAIRLCPINPNEALLMLKELKGFSVLEGIRGKQGVSVSELVKLIVKVSELVLKYPQIKELDINPVIGNNEQFWVVDARVFVDSY